MAPDGDAAGMPVGLARPPDAWETSGGRGRGAPRTTAESVLESPAANGRVAGDHRRPSHRPDETGTVALPVTFALGRRLFQAGVVQPNELRRAVFVAASSDVPFARALADVAKGAARAMREPLDDADKPKQRSIQPVRELVEKLPEGLPARLLALPVRVDPRTATVDVAIVDPQDEHAIEEIAFHLAAPVRAVVTSLDEMERAIAAMVAAAPAPRARPSMLPPAGASMPPGPPLSFRPPAGASVRPPPIAPPAPPGATMLAQTPAPGSVRPPAVVPPSSAEEEAPLLLVRRARGPSMVPPPPAPAPPPDGPRTARMLPPSRPVPARLDRQDAPPQQESRRDTADFERPRVPTAPPPPMPMVLDFGAHARESRDIPDTRRGAPPAPSRAALSPKLPPYGSLTRVLEALDSAEDRDELVATLLEGLGTFARVGALFAARKGRFAGVAADGLDLARFRASSLASEGAIVEAIELGERVGVLRSAADQPLLAALELAGAPSVEVVLRPAFVAGRPALLLAAFGVGDLQEGARRARALATAASAALERLVKGARGA